MSLPPLDEAYDYIDKLEHRILNNTEKFQGRIDDIIVDKAYVNSFLWDEEIRERERKREDAQAPFVENIPSKKYVGPKGVDGIIANVKQKVQADKEKKGKGKEKNFDKKKEKKKDDGLDK